ncbi:leucine-rich repeat-containing protein 20 isoform X3 [Myotis myotis]|uniref:leucine-rich repeat-containing protein 20 isoform X3 n=1 Tax=Myotis myotis TaxID=51298 RepID=UPI00174CC3BE|nr:leucine-rich repeat-containing protein 20 isoform X3 [Myotis myotis]
MLRKMGEAVARVARKVNETVESDSDTLDLAECKLVSFPIGIYKVLRNVTDQIHLITLANNELKSLTSKFMTTFCQLQGLWEAQNKRAQWEAPTEGAQGRGTDAPTTPSAVTLVWTKHGAAGPRNKTFPRVARAAGWVWKQGSEDLTFGSALRDE